MKRIAYYLRVSTGRQEKEETIDNQRRDLGKIYDRREIVRTYEDNPGSGADPDRQGLKRLLNDARLGLFDTVAVWDSSRLARDVKLFLSIKDELKECRVRVEIMGKERDDSDTGRFFETIEAAVDELERSRIKRRFTSGRERRLSQGKLIGCYPPYGYKHIRRDKEKGTDAYFKIYPPEAVVVKKIFKWYLELESIFLVTKRLYEHGIKSRGKVGIPKFFLASMVKKVLIREDYIGNHYFGKSSPCVAKFHLHKIRKYRLTGRRANPRSEWRRVDVPAIVDKKLFYKAQEIMKKRSWHDSRIKPSKYEYLCKGLIRCSHCKRLYGAKIQKNFQLYSCPQRRTQSFNEPRCRSRTISRRKIDEFIWDYVKTLVEKGGVLKGKIRLNEEKRKANMAESKKNYDSLVEEKRILKGQKQKLLELYTAENAPSKEDIGIKLKDLDEKEEALDARILEAEGESKVFLDMGRAEKEIEDICEKYRNKVKNPSFELKRKIVQTFIEEINIMDNGVLLVKVNISNSAGEDFSSLQGALYRNIVQHSIQDTRKVASRQ